MWYKREEQPLRHGIWFLGNAIATMFGGLLAFGISHIGGALSPWRVWRRLFPQLAFSTDLNVQWLFIIFGVITLVWAVVLIIFLPDTPEKARFLNEEQRIEAINRIRSNHTGMKNNTFKWEHVREVLTDRNVLLLMLFQFTFSIPNGAYTTVISIFTELYSYF